MNYCILGTGHAFISLSKNQTLPARYSPEQYRHCVLTGGHSIASTLLIFEVLFLSRLKRHIDHEFDDIYWSIDFRWQ